MASNATSVPLPEGFICTPQTCSLDYAFLQYYPTFAGNLVYLIIFAVMLLPQVGLSIRHKTWGFLVGFFGGIALEILGYIGRLMLHHNPFDFNSFIL